MNRQNKFRAWDRVEKKMTEVSGERFWDHEYPTLTLFSIEGESNNSEEKNPNDFILMQFTGLLDKNGKEIYEGDIVLIPDEEVSPITDEGQGPIETCNHIVPVEFRDGEFGFEISKTDDGETGWFTWRTWNEYRYVKEIEVIGNIYENPELIEK